MAKSKTPIYAAALASVLAHAPAHAQPRRDGRDAALDAALERAAREEVARHAGTGAVVERVAVGTIRVGTGVDSATAEHVCGTYRAAGDARPVRFLGFVGAILHEPQMRPEVFARVWEDACVRGVVHPGEYFERGREAGER